MTAPAKPAADEKAERVAAAQGAAPVEVVQPTPPSVIEGVARPVSAPVLKSPEHQRIEAGLNFWKPLVIVVGGSVILLLAIMAAIEGYGTFAANELYAEALQKASKDGGVTLDSDKLRALQAIANDARENLQRFRTAWLQAAQLILVNLLLPVLTALLGYIFGVQQGRASEAAERKRDE